MQITTIQVSQISELLKLTKLERDLIIKLHTYNEQQKLQLERMKAIKSSARALAVFKPKYKQWYDQQTPELKQAIRTHSKY